MRKVRLKDIGTFYSGLSGKSKKDFSDGNALLATYRNIFNNPVLNLDIKDTVVIGNGEKQNEVMYGDILFTGSSETPEEAGMSSVVMSEPKEKIYLNSFCFGFRLNNIIEVLPSYMGHLLRSESVRKAISKTAFGVTRFNVNKTFLSEIEIPIPPLTIQREIVSVLDSFTTLIDKMKQEVVLRKKQMEYYREKLLSFDEEIRKLSFGKDFTLKARIGWQGLTKKEYLPDGEYKLITGTDFTTNNTIDFDHCVYVSKERYEQDPYIQIREDDVLITKDGTLGKIAYISELPMPATLNGGVFVVRGKTGEVTQRFLKYYLISNNFKNWIEQNHTAGSIMHLTQKLLEKFNIPVPSPSTQEDIVSTLDAFEQYISKLERLITLREKQYVYYREKLLTFE